VGGGGGKLPRGALWGILGGAAAAAVILCVLLLGGRLHIGTAAKLPASSAGTAAQSSSQPAAKTTGWDEVNGLLNGLDSTSVSLVSSDVSDYPLVRLYFRIQDQAGDPVTGLSSAKIALRERASGGKFLERKVKSFEQLKGREGLSIDLVGDKSGSMDTSLSQVQNVMSQFVKSLDYDNGDRVELICFDSYIMYMCTYTSDTALMENGINNMTADGQTALYDALIDGINSAKNQTGARCVIAFTDGCDNRSTATPQEVISLATSNSVPVYIIGAGEVDATELQNITTSTGGQYWDIDELYDMSSTLQSIYVSQKDMYCVEYTSDTTIGQYDPRDISFAFADSGCGGSVTTSFTPVQTLKKTTHTSRYEVVKADISWEDANQACLAKGGHLATITSQAEMDQVTKLAQQAGLKYLWLGGYTSVRDNTAFGHWVTGENFDSYTAWYPGEPSRNDNDGTPEMYVMLWYLKGGWSWNDQRNDPVHDPALTYFTGKSGYICEYED
jgi:VWFA-related protein